MYNYNLASWSIEGLIEFGRTDDRTLNLLSRSHGRLVLFLISHEASRLSTIYLLRIDFLVIVSLKLASLYKPGSQKKY